MVEGFVVGVPLIAAVVYLVIEVLDLKIWWNKKRTPPDEPPSPGGVGETWPEHRRAEAEDEWRKLFGRDHDC